MELSIFPICKKNGGGQVIVGRVGERGKGYSVRVFISMEAYLNFFYLLSYFHCCS